MSCWQVIGSKFSQGSVTDIGCFSVTSPSSGLIKRSRNIDKFFEMANGDFEMSKCQMSD